MYFLSDSMVSGFRSSVWDPILIVSQIVTMQAVFYASLGICIGVLDFVVGVPPGLHQFFLYADLRFKETQGKLLLIAFAANCGICAIALWYVVKRTKQCLDFVCTLHFFHFLICWIYNGRFPHTFVWWFLNIVAIAITTVVGEFLCMRTELKAIPLGNGGPKSDL